MVKQSLEKQSDLERNILKQQELVKNSIQALYASWTISNNITESLHISQQHHFNKRYNLN